MPKIKRLLDEGHAVTICSVVLPATCFEIYQKVERLLLVEHPKAQIMHSTTPAIEEAKFVEIMGEHERHMQECSVLKLSHGDMIVDCKRIVFSRNPLRVII